MITECAAILAISLCLIVIFIRAGHKNYAPAITPILAVPFAHLLAIPASLWIAPMLAPFPRESIIAFADIGAVVVCGLLIMFFAQKIKNPAAKKVYIILLGGYNIVLTCAFVHRTLTALWR